MGNKPLREGSREAFPSGWLLELGVHPAAGSYGVDAGRGTALSGEDGRQALLSFGVACLCGYLALPPPALFPFVLGYAEMQRASCLLCLQVRCREYRLGPLLVAVNP